MIKFDFRNLYFARHFYRQFLANINLVASCTITGIYIGRGRNRVRPERIRAEPRGK